MSKKTLQERYEAALHAVQSGVALEIGRGGKEATPKHLRVGVNSAMCEHASLAELLIEKGVITRDEYAEAVVSRLEDEADRYRERHGVDLA